MGKSRRRGTTSQRSDPIAKPVKPPSDPELAALREKSILPVLKDLQGSDAKSRIAAATAVANIIQDSRCRKLLLREQVVRIVLTETLTDASVESRAAGWEILKLLTQAEEADFCVHLSRVDIITAIEHAAKKIIESLSGPNIANFSKSSQAEQRLAWSIAESLTTITCALAEARDDILETIVRNEHIIKLLFTLISSDLVTVEVANNALSCMVTLTEDNIQFAERILGDEETSSFKRLVLLKARRGMQAVLACGVLHNVFSVMQWDDANPGRDRSSDASLIPSLSSALMTVRSNGNFKNGDSAAGTAEILQLTLEILASIGTSLQVSFEKGNKTGDEWKVFDDEDTAMDADEDASDKEAEGEDDEMNEDEIEADMEMVTGADDYFDEISGIDYLPTLKELIQKAIPQIVRITKASDKDEETSLISRGHAFTALNNIAWSVSCLDFSEGQNAPILAAWTPAGQLIWKEAITPVLASDTSDVSIATVVTSLAWAIARTLHEKTPLSGDEQNKFMSLYNASTNLPAEVEDPFQGLGIKCLGVLGQLASDPAPIQLNREIGVFLLTVITRLPEIPAADAVETFNQLFDIYGDESYASDREVFWVDDFLKYFVEAAPKLKAMAKKVDKRTSKELRTHIDEVILNLSRFIQYKQKHKPQG
ncbi:hypothetical protein BJ170DRAFT_614185 [Xylariales sp. AK1849]|nr:hypothetical protein BJ170DRAFT_614185 [Xylariales sp. AK1849]